MNANPYVSKPELVARLEELNGIDENCILKNERSRIFGQIVLELYAQLTGLTVPSESGPGDGWDTIIGDTLIDLQHFADSVDVDFDEAVSRSNRFYDEEAEATLGSKDVCGGCATYLGDTPVEHHASCPMKDCVAV